MLRPFAYKTKGGLKVGRHSYAADFRRVWKPALQIFTQFSGGQVSIPARFWMSLTFAEGRFPYLPVFGCH
jgi:hypothetical protein